MQQRSIRILQHPQHESKTYSRMLSSPEFLYYEASICRLSTLTVSYHGRFTAATAPQRTTPAPHTGKDAPPSTAAPTKRILKSKPQMTEIHPTPPPSNIPQGSRPIRQLAPKPPPPTPTIGIKRVDSLINDGKSLHIHLVNIPSRVKTTETNDNTSTTTNTSNDKDDTVPHQKIVRPPKETAKPSLAHKIAKNDMKSSEGRDHRNGMHDGRNSYHTVWRVNLSSIGGESVPWAHCKEYEQDKKSEEMETGGVLGVRSRSGWDDGEVTRS
jgi:hypothetical protein